MKKPKQPRLCVWVRLHKSKTLGVWLVCNTATERTYLLPCTYTKGRNVRIRRVEVPTP